ncbi:MAG: peptidyl-prolyl cis-trans isomerase [Acidiferrobacteraceae bacterium]|nr:peptidyl-prolyl cis-trans isomerase [Acidiferrobacteraceae bacterium]MBT4403715.1 peptidyl-prolyl cis-trans isomerase [Acidiferrobacteraceae bacterium]
MTKPHWLFFILIGGLAYLFESSLALQTPNRPAIGPISESRIQGLKDEWRILHQDIPTPEQLSALIQNEIDNDMLFEFGVSTGLIEGDPVAKMRLTRNMLFLGITDNNSDEELIEKAISLDLHLNDEVIKRRVVQLTEQLLLSRYPPTLPTPTDIAKAFIQRYSGVKTPSRYSLYQVYLDPARASDALRLLERARSHVMDPEMVLTTSSPSLLPSKLLSVTLNQIRSQLGDLFVDELKNTDLPTEQWLGPINSHYGVHLVWITHINLGAEIKLEDVRPELEYDLRMEARTDALARGYAELRKNYEIRLQ